MLKINTIYYKINTNFAMIRSLQVDFNFSITSQCMELSQSLFISLSNCLFTNLSEVNKIILDDLILF